jgi:hypothetical protein
MLIPRFDKLRLRAVEPQEVSARSCPGTEALLRACRLGAGPATRPWIRPWGPSRIEWPFGVLHVADAEVARRACLALDGSWGMADATSGAARWQLRLAAVARDMAWWRPLAPQDAWDAGVAESVVALLGFRPRRATLIVLDGARLGEDDGRALAQLEQQARHWSRAVRLVMAGGPRMAFARPVGV